MYMTVKGLCTIAVLAASIALQVTAVLFRCSICSILNPSSVKDNNVKQLDTAQLSRTKYLFGSDF